MFRSSWRPCCWLCPLPPAAPTPGRSRTSTESSEAPVFPRRCCITPCLRTLCLTVTPFLGGLGCSCHKPLKAPSHLVLLSAPPGLCHLLLPPSLAHATWQAPLPASGPVSLRAPTLLPKDTDLLVGSRPQPLSSSLSPGAGGWPPAPCEGRTDRPSRESTRVSHFSNPSIQAGLLGCLGTLAWGLSPDGAQMS